MWKRLLFVSALCVLAGQSFAQMYVHDQSIIYQQERMVFKQWDQDKFTPTHGFLWLNPLYWLTWAWHTDYHNTDRRPLSGSGPQTQRLALVAAMQNTDNAYKLQADTLRNTAVSEAINYNGLLSDADPLWLLYYSKQFKPLLQQDDAAALSGVPVRTQQYLQNSGTYSWYLEESHSLAERLNSTQSTTLDRGSRILAYYRLLAEWRRLSSAWETRKQQAGLFLRLSDQANQVRTGNGSAVLGNSYGSDIQIGDRVLGQMRTITP